MPRKNNRNSRVWGPDDILRAMLVGTYCLGVIIAVTVVAFLAINRTTSPEQISYASLLGGVGTVVLGVMSRKKHTR
jgi:hypothetical protein